MNRKKTFDNIHYSYNKSVKQSGITSEQYNKLNNKLKLCYSLMDAYFLTESILMHTKSPEYSELHKNAMKNYEIQLNIILNGWKT